MRQTVRFGSDNQSPVQQRRRVTFEQPEPLTAEQLLHLTKRELSRLTDINAAEDNFSGSTSLSDADISSVEEGYSHGAKFPLELDYDFATWENFRNSRTVTPGSPSTMVKNFVPPPLFQNDNNGGKPYKTKVVHEDDLDGVAWSPFDDRTQNNRSPFYTDLSPRPHSNHKQTSKNKTTAPPVETYRVEKTSNNRQHHNSVPDNNNNALSEPNSGYENRRNPMLLPSTNSKNNAQVPPIVETSQEQGVFGNNNTGGHLKNKTSDDKNPGLYSYLLSEDRKKIVGPFKVHMEDEEVYQVKNPPPDPPPQKDERSHALFSVGIESSPEQPANSNDDSGDNIVMVRRGKLTFVDLAGSEKNSDIEDQQREATSINKGLLVLGKCIQALSKDELGHVPYRDSKLTKVLADSLGGQSFTVMVACISPSKSNMAETLTTLRYAGRARLIRTDPALRVNPLEQMMSGLHHELKLLRTENEQLKQHLNTVKNNNTKPGGEFQPPAQPGAFNNNTDKEAPSNNSGAAGAAPGKKPSDRQDNDFYDMLQEFMVENENLRQENTELQRVREKILEDCERIGHENENLKKQIGEITKMLRNEPGIGKRTNKTQNVLPINHNNKQDNVNGNEFANNGGRVPLPGIPSGQQNGHNSHSLPASHDDNRGVNNNNINEPDRRNGIPPIGTNNRKQNKQNNNNQHQLPQGELPPVDDVGPLMPPPPSKVTNYPYSMTPSAASSNGFHLVKQQPVRMPLPPPVEDFGNIMRPQQPPQQQPQPQQTRQPRQNYAQPAQFIEPYSEPSQYTGRETNRKLALRHSPIMRVALPAVLRPPVLLYGQPPPPTNAEKAIVENDRLSQELKDLDRLIRHHYH